MFFDSYPRFYATGIASPEANRLEQRYQACIHANLDIIADRSIIDLGSHDGRWTLAALKRGATHVTGVEGRQVLVDAAVENLNAYDIKPGQYEMRCSDVFTFLNHTKPRAETVFCFGFLYHTIRHAELLDLMERTGAHHIIIDTEVVKRSREGLSQDGQSLRPPDDLDTSNPNRHICRQPFQIQLMQEAVADGRMAIEEPLARTGRTVVARPSVEMLVFLLDHFGFDVREIDWEPYIRVNAEAIDDYRHGWRATFVATRRQVPGRNSTQAACGVHGNDSMHGKP
jgi:hypothetical protein